ncbi:MAG: N-acetylmuramoyl-L-alanine amidase [Bacteroidaceae bacterium]|nr:N-acetylmuramoyl-L-alanine amidase [Bacteroidaceae bacterium]
MRRFLSIAVALLMVCSMAAKNVIWVIDAGHGGHDVGCEFGDVYEKDITLAVAKEVGRLIGKNIRGVRVVYTREKNKFLSLQERCNIANARGAELFLSIHVNSAPNQFARGTESFFATNVPLKGSQAGKSELLALLLQKHYLGHGREVSRGVKKRELYVCENTTMPGVLTEVGFITNSQERDYITSAKGQTELAEAIVDALTEWKKLTADGKVPRQTLRNLHFTHYDPRTEPAKSAPTATTLADKQAAKKRELADAKAKEAAEAKVIAEAQAEEQAKAQAQQPAAAEETATTADCTTPTAATDSIAPTYFAIQLMNTAKPLQEGDHRLKGFQGVRFIPAGDRFKGIYSRSDSYLDIKNELVQVRETFPEAFIVAFRGDQQITTAEAIQLRAR